MYQCSYLVIRYSGACHLVFIDTHICTYTHRPMHTVVYMYVYMHKYVMYIVVFAFACMCVCVFACVCVCMCVCKNNCYIKMHKQQKLNIELCKAGQSTLQWSQSCYNLFIDNRCKATMATDNGSNSQW